MKPELRATVGGQKQRSHPTDIHLVGRSLELTFGGGGFSALVWLLLPHEVQPVVGPLLVVAFLWVTLGTALWLRLRRVPSNTLTHGLLLAGNLTMGVASVCAGDPTFGIGLFYLWIGPYAFWLLPRRQALVHVGLAAISLSIAMLIVGVGGRLTHPLSDYLGWWFIMVSTTLALGLLIDRLTAALRQSDTRVRRGFEGSPVGIAVVSPDLHFVEVNDELARMLGRTHAELEGLSIPTITYPDDLALSRQAAVTAPGPRVALQKRYIRPDGSLVWTSVQACQYSMTPGRFRFFQPHPGHYGGQRNPGCARAQ